MNNRNNDNRNRGALASFIFLIVLLVISLIMIYTMTGRETNVNESYSLQESITTTDRCIVIGGMNDEN